MPIPAATLTTPTVMATTVFWSNSMAWIRGYRAPALRRRGSAAMVVGEHGVEERKEYWVVVSREEVVVMAMDASPVGRCCF